MKHKEICSEKQLGWHYYPATCNKCGWKGSSSNLVIDQGLEDCDIYCPRCDSWDIDEYHCNYFPWYQFIFDFIWMIYGNPKRKYEVWKWERHYEKYWREIDGEEE